MNNVFLFLNFGTIQNDVNEAKLPIAPIITVALFARISEEELFESLEPFINVIKRLEYIFITFTPVYCNKIVIVKQIIVDRMLSLPNTASRNDCLLPFGFI